MKDQLPVVLNVYIINEDSLINSLGITLYHTAIEYDNTEYAFGSLDEVDRSGVYDIKPMSFDEGTFVESINLGTASRRQFFVKLEKLKLLYLGTSYNLLTKNCNHFTNDFIRLLFNKEIPKKFTSFLKLGEFLRNLFNIKK
jgi:hypothetical protein